MLNFYRTRLIILVLSVMLSIFFLLSIDSYKNTYYEWNNLLTEIKFTSYELDESIHYVRSGMVMDYDQITKNTHALKNSLDQVHSLNLKPEKVSLINQFIALIEKRQAITLPTNNIDSLISNRIQLIDDFKSNLSILRNSELINLQLIKELRDKHGDKEKNLTEDLNHLENVILRIMSAYEMPSHEETHSLTKHIQSKYRNNYLHIDEALGYISIHVSTIDKITPLIKRLVAEELTSSHNLIDEIERMESLLLQAYNVEHQESNIFFYLSVASTFLILVFSIWQAKRVLSLTSHIQDQNANLEKTVTQRTKKLKQTTNHLQNEKIERGRVLAELAESKNKLKTLINSIDGCVYEYSILEEKITFISKGVEKIWGISAAQAMNGKFQFTQKITENDKEQYTKKIAETLEKQKASNIEYRILKDNDQITWVRDIFTPVITDNNTKMIVGVAMDITELKKAGQERALIEKELSHAQKLESVGQLAAGIAHEINTPAQFISDNLIFLQESVDDILCLIKNLEAKVKNHGNSELNQEITDIIINADMEYLGEEIPSALKQSYDGISRVSKIVRAMKDYSHPGETMEASDINTAIESTLVVSRSEWKYFANMNTELEENLPLVECVISDINQVILNMVVNASHAIVDRYDNPDEMEGLISVRTRSISNAIQIDIADNGKGMPEAEKEKIFDQFFTTKEVGKGTGQGLSIARRLIVEKHGGKIEVKSASNKGTTFTLTLPLKQLATDEGNEINLERNIA